MLVSICSLTLLAGSFVTMHTLASRGKSLGLELFGLRLQSIASPAIEDSSLSRLLLLPNILEKIKQHPITGDGLGDQVTVYSPVIKQTITTPQFDWGYFELVAEFGAITLIGWAAFIGMLIRNFWLIRSTPNARSLFASFITLSVINITSPAFFHVLGILWLAGLLAESERIKKQLVPELPLN
jgi:O-antigen ligase